MHSCISPLKFNNFWIAIVEVSAGDQVRRSSFSRQESIDSRALGYCTPILSADLSPIEEILWMRWSHNFARSEWQATTVMASDWKATGLSGEQRIGHKFDESAVSLN